MTIQRLHIDNTHNQLFKISVEVDETVITLEIFLRYNTMAGYWVISITDANTGELLLDSVPLLPGVNLLEQYGYLKIGSCGIINMSNLSMDALDDTNLGQDFVWDWDDTVLQ